MKNFLKNKTVTGAQIASNLFIGSYRLSFLILKHNPTIFNPPKIPLLRRIVKLERFNIDTANLLQIIRTDPDILLRKVFLSSEIKTIIQKEKLYLDTYICEYDSEPSFMLEIRTEHESEIIKTEESTRPDKSTELETPAITDAPDVKKSLFHDSLRRVIEVHESQVERNQNVFALFGRVWFAKFQQDIWGLFPDNEKYRYIAHVLELSRESINNNLEYSIYNTTLVAKIKGKNPIDTFFDDQEYLNILDLNETITPKDLERFREIGYGFLERLTNAIEDNNEILVKDCQEKIDNYRSYLFNEYGIMSNISNGRTLITFKWLARANIESERIRQQIKNQVNNALQDLDENMPSLGRHLRNSLKTKLKKTTYTPETEIKWYVSI